MSNEYAFRIRKIVAALLTAFALRAADNPPLPDIQTIKQRAVQRIHQETKDLERYSCDVLSTEDTLKPDGSVKQTTTKEFERFFVNGQEIDHLLKKDGAALSHREGEKEQERVNKEVRKDSDQKRVEKLERDDEKELDSFLRALRFTNGHRETRDGRSMVVYDLSGDPSLKPSNLNERFAEALDGRIWVDEVTGSPVEMDFKTDRDVKVVGGLANLHKGFRLHVTEQLLANDIWIEKMVDVQGDARALFKTARFRAHEVVGECHVYNVETQSTIEPPKNGIK